MTTATSDDWPLYPDVEVQLSGTSADPRAIVGRVRQALRDAGYKEQAKEFVEEALSGDYDHVLQTCMKWVEVS